MKKLILFSLAFIVFLIGFWIPAFAGMTSFAGMTTGIHNALAATDSTPITTVVPQIYTRWAGPIVNGIAGSQVYDQKTGGTPSYPLTSIGVAGDFQKCSLFIKTAPVSIVNNNPVVDFNNVSGWTQFDCLGGGVGTAQTAQRILDYTPNYVITGWNWQISSNTNTPVCYYEEYAPLDKINNVPLRYFSCGNLSQTVTIKATAPAPPGSAIVGIALSVSPGTVSHDFEFKRIYITPPPAVAQVEPPVTPGGSNITTPIPQKQTIQTETNKIVQLTITNAVSEGEAYQWDLISGSGAYIPKDPSRYSTEQNVSFDSQYFDGISSGARIIAGPFLKIAFSDALNLKNIKVTKGTLETNFTVTVNQPSVAAPILGCTATPAEVKVGERVTATAFGTDTGVGNYSWSLPSDGRIISGGNTYNPLFSFSGAGQKAISVSHTVSGSTITASSCSVVNVIDAPNDLCSNINGIQEIVPNDKQRNKDGRCWAPPTCTANPYPFTNTEDISGAIKQVFLVNAQGGDGQNYTWHIYPPGSPEDIKEIIKLNSSDAIGVVYKNPGQAVNKAIIVESDGLTSNPACWLKVAASPPPPDPIECKVVPNPNNVDPKPYEADFITNIFAKIGLGIVGRVTNIEASGGDGQLYNWFSSSGKTLLDEMGSFGTMSNISISRDSTLFSAIFNSTNNTSLVIKSGGLTKLCRINIMGQSSTPEKSDVVVPPPPIPLPTCQFKPNLSQQRAGVQIPIVASGGDGTTYKWEILSGGTLIPDSLNTAWAIFSNSGPNSAQVTSGGLTSEPCYVNLPFEYPTIRISVDKSSIIKGESVILSWNSTNVKKVSINQGIGANLFGKGQKSIFPTNSVTYTATAIGLDGTTVRDSVSVTVMVTIDGQPPTKIDPVTGEPITGEPIIPEVTCTPSSQIAEIGQEVSFSVAPRDGSYNWSSPNPDSDVNSNNDTATAKFSSPGPKMVIVSSAESSATCNVDVATPPQPKPTVNIWTDPVGEVSFPLNLSNPLSEVTYTVNWSSTNADSCTASSGDWSGAKSTGGSQPVTKSQAGTYTYEITCSNSAGAVSAVSAQTSINVVQKPVCSFLADPTQITLPQYSTLKWKCRYASGCSLDGVTVDPIGEKQVRPSKTTTFNLSCSGVSGGFAVEVPFPPVTVSIGVVPWWKEIIPLW